MQAAHSCERGHYSTGGGRGDDEIRSAHRGCTAHKKVVEIGRGIMIGGGVHHYQVVVVDSHDVATGVVIVIVVVRGHGLSAHVGKQRVWDCLVRQGGARGRRREVRFLPGKPAGRFCQ